MNMKQLFTAVAAVGIVNLFAGTLQFECSSNKEDCIYKAGEKIVFTVKLLEDGQAASDKFIQYWLHHDDKVVRRGKISAAEELTVETSLDKPGWAYIRVIAKDGENKELKQPTEVKGKMIDETVRGGIGAVIEPEKLHPVLDEPEDFDAFWDKVKAELAAVPMKELERVSVPDPRVQIWDVKIACAGEMPVSAYLCMPKAAQPKSCPAIVSFHGAGVNSSAKQILRAKQGFIAMDVNAHGIENGKPKAFYDDLRKNFYFNKTLDADRSNFYAHWYKTDREKFYFKGMYMRVMRALEYVKSLPEWDGKNLIVSGGSQGGAQVIAACALDHDITLARAGVPAMCDHSGCLGGRRSGWPRLYTEKEDRGSDIVKCASYYDGAYFAKRIKCPIWICTGFMDATCPPTSVFAAYNNIPVGVEKHMYTNPRGRHKTTPDPTWTEALKDFVDTVLKK